MDKILEKLEGMVEKKLDEFETKPVKTGLKILVACYIIKKALSWFKEK